MGREFRKPPVYGLSRNLKTEGCRTGTLLWPIYSMGRRIRNRHTGMPILNSYGKLALTHTRNRLPL